MNEEKDEEENKDENRIKGTLFEVGKRMICPKCGGDTFIMVSDAGLKCKNCGYVYSTEREKNV